MFKKKYKLIEVEKNRTLPTLEGDELRNALISLQAHPGFVYILNKLRTQRFSLEGRLKGTKFERIEDITFLQSGIFWTNWLESEVNKLTETSQSEVLAPSPFEDKLFTEIDQLLDRVGQDESNSY